jgi:two-component system sensor kinase FixL
MVGHDLRNPLTGIASAAYFLKKKYGPQMDDAGRDMLKVIESNVAYSDKIINDLLEYSRNIILNLTKTNLKLLVGKAQALINVPANIEVVDSTGNSPEIIVDETKIIRVFANLMKNAVDAMPQGGKLTVRSEESDGEVRILVGDTGEGISEEDQKKLFQPLFTTKAKGMGFGLAICQRIIEAHRGRISVESTLGKGTTFKINIPSNPEDKKLIGYTNH